MATTISSGIVLASMEYSDYDRIVTIFTENLGKFSFLARGVNKLISKNKYSLGTFSYSNFEFFKTTKRDGLSKLKTGVLVKNHNNLCENYNNYQYASAISYLIQNGLDYWQPKYELYQNLLLALDNLDNNDESLKNFTYFLFYGLPTFGGPFIRDICSRCGLKGTNYILFQIHDLHLICINCQLEDEKNQDKDWLEFIHFLATHKMEEALTFLVNEQFIIILAKVLINYYRETLGLDGQVLQLINQKPILSSITNDLINFLLQ